MTNTQLKTALAAATSKLPEDTAVVLIVTKMETIRPGQEATIYVGTNVSPEHASLMIGFAVNQSDNTKN